MNNRMNTNPMGNMMNIGYGYNQGYMGGYYSPNSNTGGGYYNPYLMHQQQKKYEEELKEDQKRSANIWKKISRNVNSVVGSINDIDEHVKKYDPVESNSYYQDVQEYNKLLNLNSIGPQPEFNTSRIQIINSNIEKRKEEFPDDMSLTEYFEKAGSLVLEARLAQSKKNQKNISKLYDGDQYSQLVKMHSGNNNYFNTVFSNRHNSKDISIDDMEVKLPDNISNEYYERKRKFLESIFK